MADKILQQLDNDANVIGYKPDLEYKKERTATGTSTVQEKQYDPEKDTTLYTRTLNSFAKNMPSRVLNDIDYVLKNIKRLKEKLAKKFNEEQAMLENPYFDAQNTLTNEEIILNNAKPGQSYSPYNDITKLIEAGNTGNLVFAEKFAEQYNSLTGSVIPDLINKLAKLEAKLNNLASVYKNLFYGNPNTELSEAKEIDNSYISDLKTRERNNEKNSINYCAIAFDSILNKTVSYTVFQDNKSAIKVAKVIDSYENPQATSNDMNILTKLFDDIEEELEIRSRGYIRNNDLELVQKAMYNYYEKRKNLNDLYSLYKGNNDSRFLGNKVQEYTKALTESIKNVNKVLLYNQNYLDKISDLEKQKYELQKISRSTSSNS